MGPISRCRRFLEQLAGEHGGRGSFCIGCAIRLVENQDEVVYLFADRFHQGELFSRQGRVGAHNNQCCIDVRDEGLGCGAISGENRP